MPQVKQKLTTQIGMNYVDVAIALVKYHHLHEGLWRVYLKFGPITGVNADINGKLIPSAFVPVVEIGLWRDEAMTQLTVDAAVVNPRSMITDWAGNPVN